MRDRTFFDSRSGSPPAKILVVGDAMLDRYTWGNAERVSPEAPVLVLRIEEREVRLGGAASVAALLRALDVEVTLAAVIGDDHDGRTIRRLIDEAGINAEPLLIDSGRPTTTKERFLGRSAHTQPHQMLRVDTESRAPLDHKLTAQLVNALATLIPHQDVVLISDYGKGVCTDALLAVTICLCHESRGKIRVLVDPARGTDFENYRGAALLKPNRLEAELAIGHPIDSPADALTAARQLRKQYDIETVVITLDRDGLVFATGEGSEHLPIESRVICDITGAGDTVLAALGLGLAELTSATIPPSLQSILGGTPPSFSSIARLANVAAGLQVAQRGVTPITRAELFEAYQQTNLEGEELIPIPGVAEALNSALMSEKAPKTSFNPKPSAQADRCSTDLFEQFSASRSPETPGVAGAGFAQQKGPTPSGVKRNTVHVFITTHSLKVLRSGLG